MTAESSLKVDPNVKIPPAVLAAAARSEEMHRQYRDDPVDEDQGEDVTPEGNEPADLATEAPLTPTDPGVQQEEQRREPKPKKAKAKEEPEPDDWEHRYKSLHGRFTKQEQTIRTMADQIRSMEMVVATMTASGNAPTEAGEAPLDDGEGLTAEEINDYGADMLKVVAKQARAEIAPLLRARDQEIASLRQQLSGVTTVVQVDAREKMHQDLDHKLPQWRELNHDDGFLAWLGLPDPYSGGIRHDMLKAAYAQNNPARVLAFFNGFLAEEAAVAPVQAGPDTGASPLRKVPLQSLAAPGRAKAAAPNPGPVEKPVFTRAQIAQFYADVAAGRYRTKEPEKQQIEKQIFEATKDGRVR
jgi:hypothetical protein